MHELDSSGWLAAFVAGLLLEITLGEPHRWHPLAGFGSLCLDGGAFRPHLFLICVEKLFPPLAKSENFLGIRKVLALQRDPFARLSDGFFGSVFYSAWL